jgi:biopolymer transport protein TolR
MSMEMGEGTQGAIVDINMTPMIDVLLVLLIIFMVITPLTPKGLEALVPQPNENEAEQVETNIRTIVVSVNANKSILINRDPVQLDVLEERLRNIFKTRAERVMFVRGDASLEFREVAQVIDIGKGAGVDRIGLLTEEIEDTF